MKKSLSLLLSIAMAFSIFASVAMGAEANTSVEAKYQALVEAGIFTGDGADQAANLDHNMTRAQFAAVLVRAFELNEDVASSSVYADLEGAGWAAGYIGAVTKAGLMNGMTANEFGPSLDVTMEQLATVLVRAFDLQQSTSGVTGTVSDWARGYVGAALQAGLISAKADYTAGALRADLVESAYVVHEIIASLQTPDVAFKATSAKTIEVTFSKPVNKDNVTFEMKNNVGNAVTVTAKDWNEANTKVTLETGVNMLAGTYTFTVKGAAATDLTGSITVEDEKVGAIQILSDTAPAELNNDGTVKSVRVSYKVVNQYGQDITRTQSVNWQTSLGQNFNDLASEGVLEITLPTQNYLYRIGSEFTVTGFILGTANLSVNATLKIGDQARVQSVEVIGLHHPSDKALEIGMSNADYNEFVLLFSAKDQYGNPVKDITKLNTQLNVFSSNPYLVDVRDTNQQYPAYVPNAGANADQLGVRLYKPFDNSSMNLGGSSTITFSPVFYSNQSVQYNLEVAKAVEVVNVTLGQPSGVVAAGDVEALIPVTALDQNGKEVTKKDKMDSNLGASIQATVFKDGNAPTFIEKDGKLYIKYVPDSSYVGPVMITTIVKTNGKMTQLQLNVREEKFPAAVSTMTSIDTALKGVKNEIKGNSFTVLDQYGTAMAMDTGAGKFYDKYALKVDVYEQGSSVAKATYHFTAKDEATERKNITLGTKGTVTLKVSAVNKDTGFTDIEKGTLNKVNYTKASEKDFVMRFVDWADITTFEVADVAKVFDRHSNTNFKANEPAITVTGKTSAGTKVNIGKVADGNYTVNTTTKGIHIVGDKVTADLTGANYSGSDVETKGLVNVAVLKPTETVIITKEVVISKATPVVTAVTLNNKTVAVNGKTIQEILVAADLKINDQYSVDQKDEFLKSARVIVTEISEGATVNLTAGEVALSDSVANATAGDKFKVTLFVGGTVKTVTITASN